MCGFRETFHMDEMPRISRLFHVFGNVIWKVLLGRHIRRNREINVKCKYNRGIGYCVLIKNNGTRRKKIASIPIASIPHQSFYPTCPHQQSNWHGGHNRISQEHFYYCQSYRVGAGVRIHDWNQPEQRKAKGRILYKMKILISKYSLERRIESLNRIFKLIYRHQNVFRRCRVVMKGDGIANWKQNPKVGQNLKSKASPWFA